MDCVEIKQIQTEIIRIKQIQTEFVRVIPNHAKYDPNKQNKADSFATLIFFRDSDCLSRPSATALLIQRVGGVPEILHLSGSPGGTLLSLRFS